MNNAVKQGIFVLKMRIERGPVDGRSIRDVLNRDIVEALFLLNTQKGVCQKFARSHDARVDFFSVRQHFGLLCCLSNKNA